VTDQNRENIQAEMCVAHWGEKGGCSRLFLFPKQLNKTALFFVFQPLEDSFKMRQLELWLKRRECFLEHPEK